MFQNMKFRLVLLVVAIIVVSLLFSSCGETGGNIKIGAIAPFTGDAAVYGEWFKNSVEIAKDEINQGGGILGRQIEIIYEDSKAEPGTGVNAARKLINLDKVSMLLGPAASGVVLAVAPIAEENKIVLLSPIASNYKISESGDYIFRIAPSDALQGSIAADWTYNDLGYKTASILYVNNDYGQGLEVEFRRNFTQLGGEVVSAEGSDQGTVDYKTQLTKIKSNKPDFIFVAVYPKEAGRVAVQAKELGIKIPIIGTDPFHDSQVIEIAGNAADGIRFLDVADVKNDGFNTFAEKYQELYGSEANIVAAESYDGLKILALAAENAGSLESDAIKNALYNIQGYNGASGTISFDSRGDVTSKTFNKYEIRNGEYISLDE